MPRAKERKIIKMVIKRLKNAKANKLNQNPITVVTPSLPTPQEQPNTSKTSQSQLAANQSANQGNILKAQRIIKEEIKHLLQERL